MHLPRPFPENGYPSLYRAADKASLEAQRNHLWGVALYQWLLVAAAGVTVTATSSRMAMIVAAGLYFAGLAISVLLAFKRWDRVWYNGRAVAESIKTRSWRFMMKADPFDGDIPDAEVRDLFCKGLVEILRENQHLAPHLAPDPSAEVVTRIMQSIREKSLQVRLDYYRSARIDEQRRWYANAHARDQRGERRWFGAIVAINVAAMLLMIARAAWHLLGGVPVEVLTVGAAGALAWLHVRRFSQNASAYSLASHEITLIRSRSEGMVNDRQLSEFVLSTEAAFSREHTQWAARRLD
jgi:hypothetical protein